MLLPSRWNLKVLEENCWRDEVNDYYALFFLTLSGGKDDDSIIPHRYLSFCTHALSLSTTTSDKEI